MAMPNIQGMDTEYKPWGGLAGIMTGEREGLQHFANLQGMEEAQLNNVLKQVEASRAANDFSNPEMERWRQAKLMGEGMQQDALGRLKQGTLGTDITAGNQKNQTETLENQAKAWMTESDMILSLPDGLAGATSGMQLSPQMQALAQQVGGIDRLKMVLPKINEMLKTQLMNTPKHMGDVSLKGVEHGNTMERVRYEQGETTARNDADNAARAADRAAQREATQASKDQSDGMRKEQELTRRMEHGRQKLKLLQDEYNQIDEALVTPVFGMTKEEKTVRKERLEKQKKDIKASAQTLVAEMDRLNSLSSFSSGEGTASKPIKLD
jgi:hypothetical protein